MTNKNVVVFHLRNMVLHPERQVTKRINTLTAWFFLKNYVAATKPFKRRANCDLYTQKN